ncbi:hypothetical protein A1O3_05495 [Capronia epimyces CBS 606.96]|uniref:Utp8 beta-propeller domain-containing protein n=1 Tax=Capronia epimyces CBS 606.96 TaxID=1182542 RepID=W9XW83_9EURO|nr:uncharacterized protein A1O3_05495 [Capronia epimyces CBS 606.96]EXJ84822.1 hypothetical protein A1O3_05495 [Capronia epimyces CBS 606.96]
MMEITAPHLLAKLPRTTKPDATTSFGNVYVVRDGVKKRRKEICVAVDGDSLSVYEVQDGKILASYPLPPSSSFSGPPCSIITHADGQPYRTTYCTVKRGDLQVQSFQTHDGNLRDTKTSTGPKLRDQHSPAVYLDFIPDSTGGLALIVQQNGALSIFSDDLKSTLLDQSLSSPDQQGIHVLAVQHLSLSEAQKTILKQRPDLVAEATPDTSYLVLVYERQIDKKITYAAFSIGHRNRKTTSPEVSLHALFEHQLGLEAQESDSVISKENLYRFGSTASHLYIRYGASFFCYDLSRLVPVEVARLHTGVTGSYEIMAISPAFAICSFQDSFRLYDLKYQSVQAYIDTKKTNLKRKRVRMASELQTGPVEFVTYFAHSARIIGRRRHQLLVIDVNFDKLSKQMLITGSKLLHNIGRGIGDHNTLPNSNNVLDASAIGTAAVNTAPDAEWQSVRKRLDQLAQAGDVAGFEDVFVNSVRRDVSNLAVLPETIDGLPSSRIAVPDFKIYYLLSKLFQADPNTSVTGDDLTRATKSLRVQVPSFRLLIWLSHLGLLSSRSVQRAVATVSGVADPVAVDAVARALLIADPDKTLLVDCLKNGFSPYVEEQAATVQVLIEQALAHASETDLPQKDLVEAEQETGESFKLAAGMEVQRLSTDSGGAWLPFQLQGALVLALDKFGTAANSRISQCLRDMFPQTEMLALIQFLRQQLFQGGHTRSFQSQSGTGSPGKEWTATVKLDAIVRLLSSCVDAIGPLGFYGGMDHEDFIGNIVPDLVTEITHAQRSLEDVTELQGILREVLRYQESLQKYRDAGARIPHGGHQAGSEQQTGTIVTLYSEASEGGDGLRNGEGLPLSLRAENVINPLKTRKGGGQVSKRSAREMNMLERRQKGQYSFERLVL